MTEISAISAQGYTETLMSRFWGTTKLLLLCAAHIPIGLVANSSRTLGIAYLAVVIVTTALLSIRLKERKEILFVCAFIAGSDVLWRLLSLPFFWQGANYLIIGYLAIGISKIPVYQLRVPPTAVLLLGFMLPGVIITPFSLEPALAFRAFSAYFSIYLVLFLLMIYVKNTEINQCDLKSIALLLIAPNVAVATVATYSLLTADSITWSTEGNFTASGGFGPNQVSTTLSLAIVMCVVLANISTNKAVRLLAILMGFWLLIQGILTFSRGGVLGALLAGVVFLVFSTWHKKLHFQWLFTVSLLAFVVLQLILPSLNDFTDNTFSARYSSFETAGRTSLSGAEIQTFLENPLGVGVGLGVNARSEIIGSRTASHTEYTRILSEHGIAGLFAMLTMAIAILRNFRQQKDSVALAWVVSLTIWSLFYMTHAATRTVAPMFLLGLSFIPFEQSHDS